MSESGRAPARAVLAWGWGAGGSGSLGEPGGRRRRLHPVRVRGRRALDAECRPAETPGTAAGEAAGGHGDRTEPRPLLRGGPGPQVMPATPRPRGRKLPRPPLEHKVNPPAPRRGGAGRRTRPAGCRSLGTRLETGEAG